MKRCINICAVNFGTNEAKQINFNDKKSINVEADREILRNMEDKFDWELNDDSQINTTNIQDSTSYMISRGKAVFQIIKQNNFEYNPDIFHEEIVDEQIKELNEFYTKIIKQKRKNFMKRFKRLNEKICIYNAKEHKEAIETSDMNKS